VFLGFLEEDLVELAEIDGHAVSCGATAASADDFFHHFDQLLRIEGFDQPAGGTGGRPCAFMASEDSVVSIRIGVALYCGRPRRFLISVSPSMRGMFWSVSTRLNPWALALVQAVHAVVRFDHVVAGSFSG
jgi:hypothetical protein